MEAWEAALETSHDSRMGRAAYPNPEENACDRVVIDQVIPWLWTVHSMGHPDLSL